MEEGWARVYSVIGSIRFKVNTNIVGAPQQLAEQSDGNTLCLLRGVRNGNMLFYHNYNPIFVSNVTTIAFLIDNIVMVLTLH